MLASKEISEDNIEYLTVANPRAGRVYLLPKIHKLGNPGCPIVSANGHPTKRISEFVDLHQLVFRLPSYVQDTTDYLTYLLCLSPSDISEETLLVSLDVVSLYTNIPHEDGIEARRKAWKTRETMDPLTKSLVDLLTLDLKCNIFEFNGDYYLQVQGAAMGTKWLHYMPTFSWVISLI